MYREQVSQEPVQKFIFSVAQVAVCVQRIVLAVETQSHAVLQILLFLPGDVCDLGGRSS